MVEVLAQPVPEKDKKPTVEITKPEAIDALEIQEIQTEEDLDKPIQIEKLLTTINNSEISEQKKPEEAEKKPRKVAKGKNKLVGTFEKLMSATCKIEVVGAENLAKVTDDENVVLATTHITDIDLPNVMAALGKASSENKRFGMTKLIQMAGNMENPVFKNFAKATGEEDWLSVNVKGAGKDRTTNYNTNDFENINEALDQGFPLVLAAYLDGDSDGVHLSEKSPGNAMGKIALSGNVIIPVSVEISEPLPMKPSFKDQVLLLFRLAKRPKVTVTFGEPIRLEESENVKNMDVAPNKRAAGEKPTEEDRMAFRKGSEEVRAASDNIMRSIADLLPEEKRGPWGEGERPSKG